MPASPVTVRIGFDLSATGDPEGFTLNDPTRGVLDGEYVLGGVLYRDVTEYVLGVSVRRGRSRRLDKYQAGTATVTFDNRLRTFDPVYTGSPYSGQIRPRRPVSIEYGSDYLFTGLVEDWNFDYALGGYSTATILCVDGFTLLAGAELSEFTNSEELPGARVNAVLDKPEVSWPAGARSIASGSQLLQADAVADGQNALGYLQLVEETENGALFIASDGVLTFKAADTPATAFADVVFSDDQPLPSVGYNANVSYTANVSYGGSGGGLTGTIVNYGGIALEYGTETLYNRVTVTREGSETVAIADDLVSQGEFGVSALAREGLLYATDAQLEPVAEYLVRRYGRPQVRIREVMIDAHGLNNTQRAAVLNLDFGDVVRTLFTPNKIGQPIDQYLTIEGVSHSITNTSHQVTFEMELITYFPFELDSDDYGILDTNVLGL